MPGVSFQALPFRVVPQLQSVVERRGENIFSIRREFHKRHRRIVIVDECLQALSTGSVPNTTKAVVTGGDDEGTVAVEMHSGNGIGMSWKGFQAFSRPNIPNAHRLVETSRNNEIALRVEVATKDVIAVSLECLETFTAAQFPDFQSFVVAGGDK